MDHHIVRQPKGINFKHDNPIAKWCGVKPSGRTYASPHERRQWNSKTRDFLRHVRLLVASILLGRFFGSMSPIEQRKIAVYSSRRMAASNSIIHVLPVIGAIVLMKVYWTRYWIGDSSDHRTMLQFVAKLHELLMQASLIDVLLCVVRTLALRSYIPLGALLGAAQAPQLSYLWSLDFLAAIASPEFPIRPKATFVLSISGLLFMIASVGPSVAVMMIPRASMLHINTSVTRYLNATEANLFPTLIGSSSKLNFPLHERGDAQTSDTTLNADGWYVETGRARDDAVKKLRLVRLNRVANKLMNDGDWLSFTIAAVPTALSSLQLSYHSGVALESLTVAYMALIENNVDWTPTTWQPFVMTVCARSFERTDNVYYINNDGSQKAFTDVPTLGQMFITERSLNHTDTPSRSSLWMPMPDNSHALLGAFFDSDDPNGNVSDIVEGTKFRGNLQLCTVSSFWRHTTTTFQATSLEFRVGTDLPSTKEALLLKRTTPITLDPEGMLSPHVLFYSPGSSSNTSELYLDESYFALNLAYALASVPGRDHTDDAAGPFYPEYGFVSGFDQSELNGSLILSQFTVDAREYGYGYGYNETATQLALAVLIAYCSIIVLYVTYSVTSGHSSIAWDSAAELVMLALQSRAPDHLGHVSVGMDSMNTFQEQVGIRVKSVRIGDTGEVE